MRSGRVIDQRNRQIRLERLASEYINAVVQVRHFVSACSRDQLGVGFSDIGNVSGNG